MPPSEESAPALDLIVRVARACGDAPSLALSVDGVRVASRWAHVPSSAQPTEPMLLSCALPLAHLAPGARALTAELLAPDGGEACVARATVSVLVVEHAALGPDLGFLHGMVADRPSVVMQAIHYEDPRAPDGRVIRTVLIHPAAAFCGGGFGAGTGRAASEFQGAPIAYDRNLVAFAHARLRELAEARGSSPLTMVDIGANTGEFALLAASLPTLHVVAFEPVPTFAAIAAASVALNGVADRVAVSSYALGAPLAPAAAAAAAEADGPPPSQLELIAIPSVRDGGLAHVAGAQPNGKDAQAGALVPIQRTSLDGVWYRASAQPAAAAAAELSSPWFVHPAAGRAHRPARVDFVKIDVEGFERDALAGAERVLRADTPPVLLEASPSNAAQVGLRGDESVGLLVGWGYGVAGLFPSGGCVDVYLQHGWSGPPRWARAPASQAIVDTHAAGGAPPAPGTEGDQVLRAAIAFAHAIFPGGMSGVPRV